MMTTNRMGLEQQSGMSNEFIDSLAERVDHADCYGGKTWFDCHEGAVIIACLRELLAYREASKEPVAVLYRTGEVLTQEQCIDAEVFAVCCSVETPLYTSPPLIPEYPATLPCPVLLEPGLRFGKGVATRLVLAALQRRAKYYAELDAMTPEERAEHDAGIEAFKAMLTQPLQAVTVPDEFERKREAIKQEIALGSRTTTHRFKV